VVLLGLAPGAASAQPRPDRSAPRITAPAAIVIEASTGDVLYTRKADDRRSIASVTKLMTALVTLENAELGDVLSAVDYRAEPLESLVYLRAGERMTVRDLLRAALLPSGNDAAATLASGTLGRRAFVREMNRRARALGLRNTHYTNPVGLDEPGTHSSARDLARLAIHLRHNAFFRKTVALPRVTLKSGDRPREVINRNALVRRKDVDGVKTGATSQAGNVLVGSATRNGVTVFSVVLGARSPQDRDDDTLALLRFGLRAYRSAVPLSKGRTLGKVDLKYRDDETVEAVAGRTVRRVLRRGQHTRVSVVGLPDEIDGPLPQASRVGTAIVRAGDNVLARVPLVTGRPVTEAGPGARLDDLVRKPLTIGALCLLLACSVPLLVLLRRGTMRRRRAGGRPAARPQQGGDTGLR